MTFLWRKFGLLRVCLSCADPAVLITKLNQQNIDMIDISKCGAISFSVTIHGRQFAHVEQIAARHGASLEILEKFGTASFISKILKRPVLLIGLLSLLTVSIILPTRIWFVTVTGNEKIDTRYILDKANDCGICFGASRRNVRSEWVKNALLSQIPQLQWAGVNTKGCVAIITVKERTISNTQTAEKAVTKIVASTDGVIERQIITAGTPLCKPGQAVKKGQVLVSGYTDCGLVIRAERADGELYAQTSYKLRAICPEEIKTRGEILGGSTVYRLFIGKKSIKISADSGISDTSCVKMYKTYYCKLPGGFTLPIGLIREDLAYYKMASRGMSAETAKDLLRTACDGYVQQGMVAGKILRRSGLLQPEDQRYLWQGTIFCSEMIGRIQDEEIIGNNGEDN